MIDNKKIISILGVFLVIILFYNVINNDEAANSRKEIAFSEFLNKAEQGQVENIKIQGNQIYGSLSNGYKFSTYAVNYPNLIERLRENNVHIEVKPIDTKTSVFVNAILSFLPFLIIVGIYMFFMRQMQSGGGKSFGFGRSKAKLLTEHHKRITFDDVAGVDEAKEELGELVDFLRDPGKFMRLGGQIPKGCLLVGPPGTGKTMLARAIAGEAGVPFFSISGSDFVEMFVGVGASRVRDMFEQGKKNAPCIIFIDEIDAVGRHRGAGMGGGNDEREQTLNQMLVEMDGFEVNEGVIIIAATNRPDVLDKALLRPGRFDRQITVSNPDVNGREQILKVHLKKIKHEKDLDVKVIARGTPGFSGAELANLVNESALLAARKNKKVVSMQDLDDAKDKVLMGPERRSAIMSEREKKITAYHEAGHAIVSLYTPASDPIHKATIIPRGQAAGMVQYLPENDRSFFTREQFESNIATAMGGRAAEEVIFGKNKVTHGASSDIKAATHYARLMVREIGLSDEVGPVFYGLNEQTQYAGENSNVSISKAELIDNEITKLIRVGHDFAKKILKENIQQLHDLADALMKHETLSLEQIKAVLNKEGLKDVTSSAKPKKESAKSVKEKKVVADKDKPAKAKTKTKAAPKVKTSEESEPVKKDDSK